MGGCFSSHCLNRYHRLDGLNKNEFFDSSEIAKYKTKQGLVYGKASLVTSQELSSMCMLGVQEGQEENE